MNLKETLECLDSKTQVVVIDEITKKSSRGTADDMYSRAKDNFVVTRLEPKEGKIIITVQETSEVEIVNEKDEPICSISQKLYDELVYLGIIDPSGVRSTNVGKSDYPGHLIQAWTIWLAYPNLTSWDHDIIKRILRTKEEGGMTKDESRILDYQKIIHICNERIRQIKCLIFRKNQ